MNSTLSNPESIKLLSYFSIPNPLSHIPNGAGEFPIKIKHWLVILVIEN